MVGNGSRRGRQKGWAGKIRVRGENQGTLLRERNCANAALLCFINLKWQLLNPNLEPSFLCPREPLWVSFVLCAVGHVFQLYSCVGGLEFLTLSKVLHWFCDYAVVTRRLLPGSLSAELCSGGGTGQQTQSFHCF